MDGAGTGGLLTAFDQALLRRAGSPWGDREKAVAAFEVAKSDYAEAGQDPVASALLDLADRFTLSGLDSALLMTAVAADLNPTFHLLCGLLSGDDRPARPTLALALELTGESLQSGAGRRRLLPGSPLHRHGLISFSGDGPLLSRRARAADRVVAHLLGDATTDHHLTPLLIQPSPADIRGTSDLVGVLESGESLVWIHSPVGAAGLAMSAASCATLSVRRIAADLHRLPPDESGNKPLVSGLITDLLLEATLQSAVLILVGAELAGHAMAKLEAAAVPVILISTVPWDPKWSDSLPPMIQAPRTSAAERRISWERWVDTETIDHELLALRLTPEDIDLVARRAMADANAEGVSELSIDRIRRAVRRLGFRGGAQSASAERHLTSASITDLVLPEPTRDEIERLLNWIRHRDEVLAIGPVHGSGGKGSGICALFSGSPGTGKTLAANVIADTLGMDLLTVDLAGVVDKYIGETEKNLERVFAQAESLNAVLFFDEADALFGSRSAIKDAKDRYANQEVAYLLQRMEQLDGLTILATNLRGNLDPAFARRLHFSVHFPDPDVPTRRQLWVLHLTHVGRLDPADPVSVELLADTIEVTGGDIRNIVMAAAYGAAADHSPVGMRHLVDGAIREFTKLGRRIPTHELFSGHSQKVGS